VIFFAKTHPIVFAAHVHFQSGERSKDGEAPKSRFVGFFCRPVFLSILITRSVLHGVSNLVVTFYCCSYINERDDDLCDMEASYSQVMKEEARR